MSAKLPYVASTGLVAKILQKVIEAKIPDRFTQDFLATKLGHSGGSAAAIIPLLKRTGFLNGDGTPTDIYRRFRSDNTRGKAMADALRKGYSELFDRNQYAGDLDQKGLAALVNQVSGAEKGNKADQYTVATFQALKSFADFEAADTEEGSVTKVEALRAPEADSGSQPQNLNAHIAQNANVSGVGMNLSYTINLNLPESTDPEVFNAIFRSLYDNILKRV